VAASVLLLVIAMLALVLLAALVVLVVWLVHRTSTASRPVPSDPGESGRP
jgi:hypothetical protein